jgi:hypothetical protein
MTINNGFLITVIIIIIIFIFYTITRNCDYLISVLSVIRNVVIHLFLKVLSLRDRNNVLINKSGLDAVPHFLFNTGFPIRHLYLNCLKSSQCTTTSCSYCLEFPEPIFHNSQCQPVSTLIIFLQCCSFRHRVLNFPNYVCPQELLMITSCILLFLSILSRESLSLLILCSV